MLNSYVSHSRACSSMYAYMCMHVCIYIYIHTCIHIYIDNLNKYLINRNIVVILLLILNCNYKANLRYEAKLQFLCKSYIIKQFIAIISIFITSQ